MSVTLLGLELTEISAINLTSIQRKKDFKVNIKVFDKPVIGMVKTRLQQVGNFSYTTVYISHFTFWEIPAGHNKCTT